MNFVMSPVSGCKWAMCWMFCSSEHTWWLSWPTPSHWAHSGRCGSMPELHFGAGKVRTSDAAVLQRLLPGSCTQTRLCFLTTEIQTGAITPLPVALEQQHLSTKIRAEEKQASNEHTYPNRTAVISSRAPFPSSHLTRASRMAAASAPISPSPRPGQGHEHGAAPLPPGASAPWTAAPAQSGGRPLPSGLPGAIHPPELRWARTDTAAPGAQPSPCPVEAIRMPTPPSSLP